MIPVLDEYGPVERQGLLLVFSDRFHKRDGNLRVVKT
jgi:hypothetical protein